MATDIGTRIKRARERRRWSQQQLADKLEVDRKTVDNWENNRTKPRSSIGALEELLGDLTGPPEPQQRISESLRREIMNEEGLTPEERQAVIDAVEKTLAKERGTSSEWSSPGDGREQERPAS